MSIRLGYRPPNTDRVTTLEAELAKIPAGTTSKGMISQGIVDLMKKTGMSIPPSDLYKGKYLGFMDYPLTDFIALAWECAGKLYPHKPRLLAIQKVGEEAYFSFTQSTIGGVVFSIFARDVYKAAPLIPRGYRISLNHGNVTLAELDKEKNEALFDFADVYNFPEVYHSGVLNGWLRACGKKGTVKVKRISSSHHSFLVTWL